MNFFAIAANVSAVGSSVTVSLSQKISIGTKSSDYVLDVPHCLDGSDESPPRPCASRKFDTELRCDDVCLFSAGLAEAWHNAQTGPTPRSNVFRRSHWRGVVITAFLLIIVIVFVLFAVYFLFRRCLVSPPMPLINGERKNYATIVNSRRSSFRLHLTNARLSSSNQRAQNKYRDHHTCRHSEWQD